MTWGSNTFFVRSLCLGTYVLNYQTGSNYQAPSIPTSKN